MPSSKKICNIAKKKKKRNLKTEATAVYISNVRAKSMPHCFILKVSFLKVICQIIFWSDTLVRIGRSWENRKNRKYAKQGKNNWINVPELKTDGITVHEIDTRLLNAKDLLSKVVCQKPLFNQIFELIDSRNAINKNWRETAKNT